MNSQIALLVDRDVDTRLMYAEFLRPRGWDVDETDDGRDALAKALTRHPRVIVTETRLFGISGFDLCQLLRHDPDVAGTSIIFVTGDAFPADIRRARLVGADEVLVKPCLPQELSSAIARSLALRQQSEAMPSQAAEALAPPRGGGGHALGSMLNKSLYRHYTSTPPVPAPTLLCPICDQPLRYTQSYMGGVSAKHAEQWDYFECSGGCGTFQYRQRTRKLRRVL